MQSCVVIGRGYNYATAFELALKLKELTYTIVEPYSSADFMHGPLAMVAPGFPVIVIAPSGGMLDEMKAFMVTAAGNTGPSWWSISDDALALELARSPAAPATRCPRVALTPDEHRAGTAFGHVPGPCQGL